MASFAAATYREKMIKETKKRYKRKAKRRGRNRKEMKERILLISHTPYKDALAKRKDSKMTRKEEERSQVVKEQEREENMINLLR